MGKMATVLLVAQPSYWYPLLGLNKYSADSNKLTGHRKHA